MIEVTRVLEVTKLTEQNRVCKSDMRFIKNALKLVEAMQSNSGVAPDVAVGRDVYENPDQDLIDAAHSEAEPPDDDGSDSQ